MDRQDIIDTISFKDDKIQWSYTIWVSKSTENGKHVGYIASFDIFVSGNSHEDVLKKSRFMVRHFIEYSKSLGWKRFVISIHKLGFRASVGHNTAMGNLLSGKMPKKTDFDFAVTDSSIPQGFADATPLKELEELAV